MAESSETKSIRIRVGERTGVPLEDETLKMISTEIQAKIKQLDKTKIRIRYKFAPLYDEGTLLFYCVDNVSAQWTAHIIKDLELENLELKAEHVPDVLPTGST